MKTVIEKIGKNIWIYVAWIVVVCVLWTAIFGILTSVSEEEKIVVFIGSNSLSFDNYDALKQACPEYVLELNVNMHSITEKNFSQSLSVFGIGEADILILPESYLQNETATTLYAEISAEHLPLFRNLGTFDINGSVYGLQVHDKDTHKSLISVLDYGKGDTEQNYYLVFNRNSLHLGELSSEENNERNGAIVVARRLLSL